MSRFFIFIYIVVVLGIAGTARANENNAVSINADEFAFDSSNFALYLGGTLNKSCESHPRPVFYRPSTDKNTFILQVAVDETAPCAQLVEGHFDMVFDLRFQLTSSGLNPKDGEITIKIGNTGHEVRLNSSRFSGALPFFNETVQGTLALNPVSGKYSILTEDKNIIEVNIINPMNPENLKSYVGQIVSVSGYMTQVSVPDFNFNAKAELKKRMPQLWLSRISAVLP